MLLQNQSVTVVRPTSTARSKNPIPARLGLRRGPRAARPRPLPSPPTSAATSTSTATTPPITTTAPATPEPASSPSPATEQFVWTRNWYPVAPTEFLDPARPHPFTLLGKELVLWRDGSGAWRAFDDACPHRLAPLSEGRVEADGTLLCAYHGWRFDGGGACSAIPQAPNPEAEKRACSNPRSCAVSYPTREAQGLLWVWGEAGPMGQLGSLEKDPAVIAEIDELPSSRVKPMPWFFRDLPYSHDYFIENVTDPAHVAVSHHNVAGNRYKKDQYVDVSEVRATTPQGGFKYAVKARSAPQDVTSSSTEFLPPSLVKITANFEGGGALILALYSCPTVPGCTRHIGRQILIRNADGRLPKGLAFFAAPMPTWLSHTLASVFLHQDLVFLHHQERAVASRAASSHTAKYFMPTPADNMTVAFRTWLGQMAGGRIPYAAGAASASPSSASSASSPAPSPASRTAPPFDFSRQALFDAYNTHTAQCSVCSAALKRLRVARVAALAGAVVATLAAALVTAVSAAARAAELVEMGSEAAAAAAAALASLPPPAAGLAALAAAACGAAAVVVHRLIGMMHRYEFSHADNH